MSNLLQVQQLTKSYGSHRGIKNITFEIAEGEVFGFLGPNGAGKTTTLRTLMGLLKPNAGQASIGGFDCWQQSKEVKRLVGYLPGEFSLDPSLTGAQILHYLANLRGGVDSKYIQQLATRLDLDTSRKFREYSRGNKQKVGLIQAFMHKPQLLILDEPTGGLDPLNQQEFYKMVDEVRSDGRSVFLSSHILPEVEHTCNRVGIIREGELVQIGEVNSLKHLRRSDVDISFPGSALPEWFRSLPAVLAITPSHDSHELHLSVQGDMQEIIQIAAQHQATQISVREPSLEEIFLHYYEAKPSPVTLH